MSATTSSVPKIPAASPFAHLAKNSVKGNKAEDDDKDKPKSEDDKDKPKSEDDDKDKPKSEDDKDKPKSEDDKDKPKSEDDKDKPKSEDDDKDKPKSEDDKDKPKSEDGDDESDEEDKANAKLRQARARERGRILSIMTSDAGLANPEAAARLATKTELSRSEAISMLHAVGPAASAAEPRKDALRDRMSNERQPEIGAGDGDQKPAGNLAQMIVAADKKRRGEK
jgi:hypothetical protein